LPPVDADVFTPQCVAYELLYGKGLTPFLKFCARRRRAKGQRRHRQCLFEQASEAFTWWQGVRPQTAAMIASLTVPLV